jgi:hypothetical protein
MLEKLPGVFGVITPASVCAKTFDLSIAWLPSLLAESLPAAV